MIKSSCLHYDIIINNIAQQINRKIHSEGYILIKIEIGKWAYEHRYVIEQSLGRKLSRKEQVHHINSNKFDNRIENLILFPDARSHREYHIKIDEGGKRIYKKCKKFFPQDFQTRWYCKECLTFICKLCGNPKTQKFMRMSRRTFCSEKCRNQATHLGWIRSKMAEGGMPNIKRISLKQLKFPFF